MRRFTAIILICITSVLSACSMGTTYTGEVPVLKFVPVEYSEAGKSCYYLFDDNPEYLTEEFLADGAEPSSIAHFSELTCGVYTIFSYHHRGTAAERETDLFFDVLFRSDNNARVKITKLGLDHDWQWNKAWADYSGIDVYLPEYLKTSDCTCKDKRCAEDNAVCNGIDCSCIVRDEIVKTGSDIYEGLGEVYDVNSERLLSDIIPTIKSDKINEIRHGGRAEPIWLMMEFEVISGSISADTVAYLDYDKAVENLKVLKSGRFVDEPQYKGISDNAPIVRANLSFTFDNTSKSGVLPVKIFNQKYPNGYIAKNGRFGVNVNTWKRESILSVESAESDMLSFKYTDDNKPSLYGEDVTDRNNVWYFDPFHTRLYEGEGSDFVPNILTSAIDYPKGREKTDDDFYAKYICNLGNFGVRYLYTIELNNNSAKDKIFKISMNSVSGHLYRYSLLNNGKTVKDDGGRYIMKRFDMQPAESTEPAWYKTTEEFVLEPNKEYELQFETVTLTGCDAPMEITLEAE